MGVHDRDGRRQPSHRSVPDAAACRRGLRRRRARATDRRPAGMSDAPLVSAIIIFLDEERFLAEAIETSIGQDYPDWELWLVDDGSTDRSTAIAREFAARMPDRIRYCEHEGHANRGMSAGRNLGLDHARGGYIGFLDADDVWEPEKLREQVG